MLLGMGVAGIRMGILPQARARPIGRVMAQQWHRQVCVKMASTALIFSALQPVRPALHVPVKHHVGQGRIARGNYSNSLLLRQCSASDSAAGTVLLETRECADGSIMYRFGTPNQKHAVSTVVDPEDDRQSQATTEPSDANVEQSDSSRLSEHPCAEDQHVVIVNGLQHPDTPSDTVAKQEAGEPYDGISDTNQEVAISEPVLPSDAARSNGHGPAETPVKDLDLPEIQENSDEAKKDETGKQETPAHLTSGAAMIPHPDKAAEGGEDAFFIEGTRWIGVADGVGGWALNGINAGLYARELMWHCGELARQGENDSDPKSLLVKSFSKTKAVGSTTAIVASISNQILNVVNIGDTGFLVIRDGVPLDRSKPMQRSFNFPYQIGSYGDDPLMAEVYRVHVQKGDVVVLGSDGLFDNLFEEEIVDTVNKLLQSGCGPEVVAEKLAHRAHKAGAASSGLSPFAKEAEKAGYRYSGGKMDDITAVVSFVS